MEARPPADLHQGMCKQRLARVDAVLGDAVARRAIAGVEATILHRQQVVYRSTFGYADLETGSPLRSDAIYRIYSMTKIVTAVAVLMLLEDGDLLLSEPVARFLPEFADLGVDAGPGVPAGPLRRPVLIHDLLTHCSGIDYTAYEEGRAAGDDLAACIARISRAPLRHQPGERWTYGASSDVLGRIIEIVSGENLPAFLNRRIFRPLDMVDTGFWVPEAHHGRLATLYQPALGGAAAERMFGLPWDRQLPGRLEPVRHTGDGDFLQPPRLHSAGAGLVSTTDDVLRFSRMLLGGGTLGQARLLGRRTVALMTSDHLPTGHPALAVNGRAYGLGVSVVRRPGEARDLASVGEFGWGGAACTQVWIDPTEDLIALIMLQYRPRARFALMDRFYQAVRQALAD